jgi:hypothetical protein
MGDVFVKCGSHRARERLVSLLGLRPQCYWSWDYPATGGYFPIPEEKLAEARKIPGVTRMKFPEELRRCLDW